MRKLIILRGAQGSGKSNFIQEKNLERFTLSSDTIRLMFNAPELTIDYTETIPQFNNKKVWQLLFYVLEERMKKGEFTLVDAIHASKEDLITYKKLAEKYRYRLYILDFTNIPKEEVKKRNKNRVNYKVVPEYSIDRAYKKFATEEISKAFIQIKPENFETILTKTPKDYNDYQNIHIIGDIHGCYSALKRYFEKNPFQEKDFYIFTGDYFDRGIENVQTFHYLTELMKQKNILFLIGNHEDKIYKYACDDDFIMDYDIQNTIKEFESKGITKANIRGFIKSLSQLAYITFKGKTYIITHGGIPYFPKQPLDYYSTNSFMYGIDKYDVDIDEIYNEYMNNQDEKIIQIHGHRNYFKTEIDKYPYSYNVEGDIEHGGCLRILTLKNDGSESFTSVKNEVYNPNLLEETKIYNLIKDLRSSKYIYEKELGNNISSFNFTKEAFYNHIWDQMTTKARGIFIDTEKNKIVARSYDKFFQVNERKETNLEEVKKTMAYPVTFYVKYNGFLGILSIVDNEFFFASKSTNTGEYVEYFKTIFYQTFAEKTINNIKEKISKENVTFVFEVIDPINDPHIIKYTKSNLILLDIIKNTSEYKKESFESLQNFANKNNIQVKEKAYVAKTKEEFAKIINEVTLENYKWNNQYIEGFVIEDSKDFMLKIKSNYYTTWKYLRTKMETALKNQKFKSKEKNSLETKFLNYLKDKYENKQIDLSKINIIEEREDFLKKEE